MSNILKNVGQALLRPIIKLRATARRNAIIYAHMSPEQLREYSRMRDELRAAKDRQREFLLRHRPPGAMF
jgi:hypothetical protein